MHPFGRRRARSTARSTTPALSACAFSRSFLLLGVRRASVARAAGAAASRPAVDELADQAFEDQRRLREVDRLSRFQDLLLAAELQRDVAVAEDSGGDDRRARVG